MAFIRIPQAIRPGFSALIALDDDTTAELASALVESPPSLSLSVLAGHVVQHARRLSGKTAEPLLGALLSLYSLRSSLESDLTTFVNDVADSVEPSGIAIAQGQLEPFKARLTTLLSISQLELRVKQVDVQTAHQRTLLSARILTDLRPVFGRDVTDRPAGALVVHSLQINYEEDGRAREFFVALDEDDLDTLARVIDRARAKGRALGSLLEAAHVPYLKGAAQ